MADLDARPNRAVISARAALLLSLLTAGCTTFRGAPQRAVDPDADVAAIETMTSSTAVAECMAGVRPVTSVTDAAVVRAPFTSAEDCRDRIVTARKYVTDVRFSQFEQQYFSQNEWAGFGATLVALGLTTAGSLSGTGTAQALSAAAAGVTGSRAAYEKEILADRTLLAIDAAMHAQRDLIAVNIRSGLAKSAQDYPLGTALSDLDAYYRAGTILGAMNTVTRTVGAQAEAAQEQLRGALPITRTSAAEFLRSRLSSGDAALIRAQMRALGVSDSISVTRFVFTGTPAQLEAVARALGWTPDAASAPAAVAAPLPLEPAPVHRPVAPPSVVQPPPPVQHPAAPVTSAPPQSAQTARRFLEAMDATSGGEDRIRAQMRGNHVPDQMTVNDFLATATREQLEAVAAPLGWHR